MDCTTVEVGFTGGLAGSLKYDLKKKRVTHLFAGVGAQFKAGERLNLGEKFGALITFDEGGSVSDIRGDASGSAKIGPLGGEASMSGGIVVEGPGIQTPVFPVRR